MISKFDLPRLKLSCHQMDLALNQPGAHQSPFQKKTDLPIVLSLTIFHFPLFVLLAKIHESFSDIRGKRMLVKTKPKYNIFEIAKNDFAAINRFCSNKAPATWVALREALL